MSAPDMSLLGAENLSVRLGDKPVLNGVGAVFQPGRVTAVVGPNGAGKSTLLDCLAALRRPDAGRTTLDGRDLRSLPARERSRRIAYLPQNAEIAWAVDGRTFIGLGRTPYVGAWGLTAEDRAAVARAMTVAGVEAFADRIVSTLSGGERARVLIARALAGEPQWLLADEPLAGLDPGHVLDACDLFRRLADEEGRGVVLTLHDLDAALRVADRVIVLAEGRVLADAAPVEALSPAVLKAAYGVEARTLDGVHGPVLEMVGRAR
ncbi:ABC transporter ATP-binding protein [Brevundimonas diminuta]|uniref:ABC transporter ATP-binding protein n=1 Tax=Brevundimonas diminuta TaxID=293 RepID=UPI0032097CB6